MTTETVSSTQEASSLHSLVRRLAETFERKGEAAYKNYSERDPHETRCWRVESETWREAAEDLRAEIEKSQNSLDKR
jgi:histidinol dehydrogenase